MPDQFERLLLKRDKTWLENLKQQAIQTAPAYCSIIDEQIKLIEQALVQETEVKEMENN